MNSPLPRVPRDGLRRTGPQVYIGVCMDAASALSSTRLVRHFDFVDKHFQGRMTAPIFSLLAAAFYLGGTLYQIRCLMRRRSASPNLLRAIGLVDLLSHAGSLYVQMVSSDGLSFGFFHVS